MSPLAVESLILTGGQCLTAFGSHVSKPQEYLLILTTQDCAMKFLLQATQYHGDL